MSESSRGIRLADERVTGSSSRRSAVTTTACSCPAHGVHDEAQVGAVDFLCDDPPRRSARRGCRPRAAPAGACARRRCMVMATGVARERPDQGVLRHLRVRRERGRRHGGAADTCGCNRGPLSSTVSAGREVPAREYELLQFARCPLFQGPVKSPVAIEPSMGVSNYPRFNTATLTRQRCGSQPTFGTTPHTAQLNDVATKGCGLRDSGSTAGAVASIRCRLAYRHAVRWQQHRGTASSRRIHTHDGRRGDVGSCRGRARHRRGGSASRIRRVTT